MLSVLGSCIGSNCRDILIPEPIDELCTARVLTMSLMEGLTLSSYMHQQNSSEPRIHIPNLEVLISRLFSSFGFQILEVGAFHSDPHPGNILISCCFGSLALIDFGQVKILPERTRVLLAQLIVSLHDGTAELKEILDVLQIKFSTSDPELTRTIAFILFDTRMDIPEARMSPFDSDFPKELIGVRISNIPTDVFMVIRVIAIFRGILAAFGLDIHTRQLWINMARDTVTRSEFTYVTTSNRKLFNKSTQPNIFIKLELLHSWLKQNNLPCDRKQMMCFAQANILSVEDIANAWQSKEDRILGAALLYFDEEERERCFQLANVQSELKGHVAKVLT